MKLRIPDPDTVEAYGKALIPWACMLGALIFIIAFCSKGCDKLFFPFT